MKHLRAPFTWRKLSAWACLLGGHPFPHHHYSHLCSVPFTQPLCWTFPVSSVVVSSPFPGPAIPSVTICIRSKSYLQLHRFLFPCGSFSVNSLFQVPNFSYGFLTRRQGCYTMTHLRALSNRRVVTHHRHTWKEIWLASEHNVHLLFA